MSSAETTRGAEVVALGRRIRRAQKLGEFTPFCEGEGLGRRKAYDLVAIADAVDAGILAPRLVGELGWSKARLIAEHAQTKTEADRSIAFARGNTLPSLTAYFQKGEGTPLVTKSSHLTPAEARELEAALLQAGGRRRGGRLENRSDALMRIIREYRRGTRQKAGG